MDIGFDKRKNKVRCSHCQLFNEVRRFCEIKQTRVSPNKKKYCSNYELDESKIREKNRIPTKRVESWYLKRSDLKKREKELEIERIKQEAQIVNTTQNTEHPLTGDLSRFKTTGTDVVDE